MKTSDFISKLKDAVNKYGDLDIQLDSDVSYWDDPVIVLVQCSDTNYFSIRAKNQPNLDKNEKLI